MKRKKICNQIKESIRIRQKQTCVCCIELGKEFHHVNPVVLGGKNTLNNLVLLCGNCHKLLHLGDVQTCITILEYVYYLYNNKLPSDLYENIISISEMIKETEY